MSDPAPTPLRRKLGIEPGMRVAALGAPPGLADRLEDTVLHTRLRGSFEVILLFSTETAQLERRLDGALRALDPRGVLWLAWPKRSSGVRTDLADRAVRALGLATGLVDNKVCAIDETWSGLRFVHRRGGGGELVGRLGTLHGKWRVAGVGRVGRRERASLEGLPRLPVPRTG